MRWRSEKGAAMAEMVLLAPVMILMWVGIDYFRSGYARRLETLANAHQVAWKLASSNDGSCFANKEAFAGFTGEADVGAATEVPNKGSAGDAFKSSTSSSMFMYAHANVGAQMATKSAHFDGDGVGKVGGGMYIACNEVVPATNAEAGKGSSTNGSDKFADQNVLTPLWDFVSNLF